MANVYQKAASYLTKKNAGKVRVSIGNVREILKDLVNQTVEVCGESRETLFNKSYLIQLCDAAQKKYNKAQKKKK